MTARAEVQQAQVEQQQDALNRLLGATDTAIRAGQTLPCLDTRELVTAVTSSSDPNPWLSDDPDDRADAAQACRGCPVATECLTYAHVHRTTFGVYGGRDFTIKARQAADVPKPPQTLSRRVA